MRLPPLVNGQDGILAKVPLFSAMIVTEILKILRSSTFMNDDYYLHLLPSPYFR